MSTGLNSMCGVIFEDLIRPAYNKPISEKTASFIMKIIVVVIGLFLFVEQINRSDIIFKTEMSLGIILNCECFRRNLCRTGIFGGTYGGANSGWKKLIRNNSWQFIGTIFYGPIPTLDQLYSKRRRLLQSFSYLK